MSNPAVFRSSVWLGLALALTALKLWLTRGQGLFAIGGAGHDDRLFLQLAEYLVHGQWLGPYNELTLAKGPFYSFFIAAVFSIGLPLFLAQQLFYAAACALFTRALRPAVTSAGARLAIYLLLLWNPMSFDAASLGRVLRQHVYAPLGLMIFAGLIALYLRRSETSRRQLPWVLLLGLAGGAFYLTREEGIWLMPSVLLLAGAYLVGSWKISRATAQRAAGWLGLALVLAALPVWFVSAQNKRYYGWFGTCEFRAGDFHDAYGAMMRVRIGPDLPFVPVTREARQAMAAVSPAFAAVEAKLADGIARGWAGPSAPLTGLPPEAEQVGGGWMVWALRDAVYQAGDHNRSAGKSMAFYRRLAREINAACDDGRLPAGPPRSGLAPRWREDRTEPFVRALGEFADFVVRFSRFSARPLPSTGSPEELVLFRDLTGERLSPPEGELDVVGAAEYLLNLWKVDVLQQIGKALRPVLLGLFVLAQVLVLVRAAHAAWRRAWTFPLTVAAAAWGGCAASLTIYAVIEATAFPVLTIVSFVPIYPLVLVFIIAAFWDALTAWLNRRAAAPQPADLTRAATEPAPVAPAPAPRALLWLAGLVALLPFVVWHREFRELFWFADDLALLDQMAATGVFPWITQLAAGNFLPLFKSLWSGAVFGFGGSYLAMLWLLWLTHALNTVLLGRLLQRAGFPWLATVAAQLGFALTVATLGTLGWAVSWSAALGATFLLLALEWHARLPANHGFSWRHHLPLFALATAAALSSRNGVLTGVVLAGGLLLPTFAAPDRRVWLACLPGALLCLVPAIFLLLLPAANAPVATVSGALTIGAGYFLLNPGHLFFGATSLHPLALLLIAAVKLGLIAGGLAFARGRARPLLFLLLAYDLGCALLLGLSQHQAGFLASLDSRHQYDSLLATLPFAAVLLAALLERVPTGRPRTWTAAAAAVLVAGGCLAAWPAAVKEFAGVRGTAWRAMIAVPATSDPAARVPGLESMHVERAKALQRAYELH